MTNRRTSCYTAHFDTAPEADKFARHLRVPVQDHGHTGITFRATDDDHAAVVAGEASRASGEPGVTYSLTTGLGVHRRDVQP